MAWRPLLDGADAERAWEAILDVAAALEPAAGDPVGDPTLAGGSAGPALFFAYLAEATREDARAEAAVAWCDRMIEAVGGGPRLRPGLFDGLVGVGWTLEHLSGRLLEPDEDDPAADIDEMLAKVLGRFAWERAYDLVSGLAGFGVYALERLPRPAARSCLESLVLQLESLAEERPEGATWHTPPELVPPTQRADFPQGYHNLGVAHGVPAVVGFLAAALEAGVLPEAAGGLLDRAVAWLLAQRLPEDGGSRFPNCVVDGVAVAPARLAWCYGDAGVAAALLGAARRAGRPAWEREARAIAAAAAVRTPESAGVLDAGLCHGAAGLGHLFNRLARATGDERLAAAARAWLRRALAMRRPGTGVAGFLARELTADGEVAWKADRGFLTGAAGVGLALLAAVSPVEPQWDRVLLASVPPLAWV